jgi:hypothetical protein
MKTLKYAPNRLFKLAGMVIGFAERTSIPRNDRTEMSVYNLKKILYYEYNNNSDISSDNPKRWYWKFNKMMRCNL